MKSPMGLVIFIVLFLAAARDDSSGFDGPQDVMQRALEAIRDTPGTDGGNPGLWRSVRCAAFATASSLVVATQHNEAFFEAPLKPAKGEPDSSGGSPHTDYGF